MIDTLQPKIDEFQVEKASYLNQEKALADIKAEKAKTAAILQALDNELNQVIEQARQNLGNPESLTADEYVDLKHKESGIKARIEYYQALQEENEIKLYNKLEEIYYMQEKLTNKRAALFTVKAQRMLSAFMKAHGNELAEIFNYIYYSQYKEIINHDYYGGKEKAAIHILTENLINPINRGVGINEEFFIENLTGDFEPKSPMQKHKESYQEQAPKGFKRLIENLK